MHFEFLIAANRECCGKLVIYVIEEAGTPKKKRDALSKSKYSSDIIVRNFADKSQFFYYSFLKLISNT